MHGLSHVVGIGPRVTINGKSYQVRGKTNRFYAEVGAEILKLRGNPFDMIVDAGIKGRISGDPDVVSQVANVVATQFRNWKSVTYSDYLEFINTPAGNALLVYHCLRTDAPELTYDDVLHTWTELRFSADPEAEKTIADVVKAIAQASGEDQLGNSNGRLPKVQEPALETIGAG